MLADKSFIPMAGDTERDFMAIADHSSLVLLSLLMSITLTYQALDTCVRMAASGEPRQRTIWLAVGTSTMGVGLVGVHFVVMLAWLRHPPVAFNPGFSVAAVVASMVTCYCALHMGSSGKMTWAKLLAGSLLLSIAVVSMHYLSLASIQIFPRVVCLSWRPVTTQVCGVVGVLLTVRTLQINRFPSREKWFLRRFRAAAGLGFLLVVLLYVVLGMAIGPSSSTSGMGTSTGLLWVGGVLGVLCLTVGVVTLGLSHFITKLFLRTQRLLGSVDQLSDRLSHLVAHDSLTGLLNRASVAARIGEALAGARLGDGQLAVLCMDLDGFKTINDTLGHAFGDDLLRAVAQRLETQLRVGSLARVGGDEFIAVLDHMRSPDSALRIVERLIESMQHDFVINGTELRVSASFGLAFHPQDGDAIEDLIAHADVAMYGAKESGRNGYRVYDGRMQAQARRVLTIKHGLRTAIEDGSLSLHYQPKHDGLTGVIVGAEALARWHHEELGTVSPTEFIAVAERSGQIARLGEWVIRETCRQLREWHERGRPGIRIAINLSPLQLNQPGMLDTASRIVSEAGLKPGQIMFEVTESQAMQDAERTTALLGEFRARGFEFAIDDFGTGYSSLAYLQKFRACQLKIDRLFIQALDDGGPEARAIITAIIALAHTLGMEVVAEGVETISQAKQLRTLGCDQLQGFLLSRPMSPVEFERRCLDMDAAAAFML